MKPVAWLYYDDWKNLRLCQTMPPDDNSFPVYTAPRELSDEEIINIWGEVTFSDSLLEFAKAILKKASEK